MPTNTDLVKDLPADFEIFGQAVDTQMKTNADAAIAKTIVDAKGDIIAATAADTVSRLAVGANNTILTADSSTATGLKWAAPASGSMTLISTTTASNSASINLTSIPGTYRNLRVVIKQLRAATDNQEILLRINNDTSTLYFRRVNTASSGVFNWGNDSALLLTPQSNAANSPGFVVVDVPEYANSTTWKFTESIGLSLSTGYDGTERRTVNYYGSTSAITQLNFFMSSGNITSGTFELYGVN
jgi:hypothetical protein